jgi:hypothetical protein
MHVTKLWHWEEKTHGEKHCVLSMCGLVFVVVCSPLCLKETIEYVQDIV